MADLTLSPCVFAMPDLSEGRTAFEEYLEGLLDWNATLSHKWIRVSVSQKTMELLFETNCYPMHPHIVKACQTFGIFEYSVNDCRRIVENLLGRASHFEEICGIDDISWTDESFDPDISDLQREQFRNESKRILVILAVIYKHCSNEKINHILGCKNLPEKCSSVAVDALVDIMEPETVGKLSTPFKLSQQIRVCRNYTSFMSSLDPSVIWYAAKDPTGLAIAIKVGWYKECIKDANFTEWYNLKDFHIGSVFLKSARQLGFCDDFSKIKMLLSSILLVLMKKQLNKVHALRISSGGSSPQKLRGKDKAWRRDIDYTYHLHYWETVEGTIEFASVATHNDFNIPE